MDTPVRVDRAGGLALGRTGNGAVTPDYSTSSTRSTGKINWVQIDLGTDDHDHFIDPEERLRVATARQ